MIMQCNDCFFKKTVKDKYQVSYLSTGLWLGGKGQLGWVSGIGLGSSRGDKS